MVSSVNARTISPGTPLAGDAGNTGDKLGWENFLDETVTATASLIGDRSQSGQDAYVYTIAANASRLGELPDVEPRIEVSGSSRTSSAQSNLPVTDYYCAGM